MKLSKIGNHTNSQDPQAVNSRIFVGNLNTFQCSKTDIERMFQRYGRLAGISMHKGYAFIQFLNPLDARNACVGEDGRNIMNQTLDVNMVAEPKPHQTGRKRQNLTKTGNDCYYASAKHCRSPVPPNKKPRTIHIAQQSNGNCHNSIETTDFKVYNNPDILICGNCRENFANLFEMIEHKRSYCKLRFLCKCHKLDTSNNSDDSVHLLCSLCQETYNSPLDLMVHVQSIHSMSIFKVSDSKQSSGSNKANSNDQSTHQIETYQETDPINPLPKESQDTDFSSNNININNNIIKFDMAENVLVNFDPDNISNGIIDNYVTTNTHTISIPITPC